MSHLELNDIVDGLHHNNTIRILHISSRCVASSESAALARSHLERNDSIQVLRVICNQEYRVYEAFPMVVQGLASRRNQLRVLKLDGFYVQDEDLAILAAGFPESTTLQTIELHRFYCMTAVGMRHIVRLLERVPVIDVSLSSTYLDAFRLEPLLAHVQSPLCRLKSSSLDRTYIGDEVVRLLFNALEQNQTLNDLNLKSVNFSLEGLASLSKSLPNLTCLHELKFSCRQEWSHSLDVFVEAMSLNTSLMKVEIDSLDDKWMNAVSFYCLRNRFLTLSRSSTVGSTPGVWPVALARLASASIPSASVMYLMLRAKLPWLLENTIVAAAASASSTRKRRHP